jgi:hypothetical protein
MAKSANASLIDYNFSGNMSGSLSTANWTYPFENKRFFLFVVSDTNNVIQLNFDFWYSTGTGLMFIDDVLTGDWVVD